MYPKHLGKEWYEMIVAKIARRLHFKNLFKETKDPTYGSMQEMGKLSLNGGAYGKLGSPGDWQEDPCAMLTVTLGCQLEILMIVEALILKGFEIVSLNTDGWDSIVPKSRLEEYFKIVSHYEKIIGNQELGNVEYTRFEWIAQTSVNHYVAKKIGEYSNGKYYEKTPELKSKGMFAYWVELWKNSSFAIFALAWQKYFDEGVDPEELIMNHDDIFDFCARSNSGKSFYHESYDEKGKATKESKLIRYYVGKKGKHIKKVVKEGNLTGAKDTNLRPADSLKVICNRLPKSSYKEHLDNVDRQWYITEVKNVIYAIENGKRPKKNNISKDQLSMF